MIFPHEAFLDLKLRTRSSLRKIFSVHDFCEIQNSHVSHDFHFPSKTCSNPTGGTGLLTEVQGKSPKWHNFVNFHGITRFSRNSAEFSEISMILCVFR